MYRIACVKSSQCLGTISDNVLMAQLQVLLLTWKEIQTTLQISSDMFKMGFANKATEWLDLY